MTIRSEQDPEGTSSETSSKPQVIQQPNGSIIIITPHGPRSTGEDGTHVKDLPEVRYPTSTPLGTANPKRRRPHTSTG